MSDVLGSWQCLITTYVLVNRPDLPKGKGVATGFLFDEPAELLM
jgi:hypothetical protein